MKLCSIFFIYIYFFILFILFNLFISFKLLIIFTLFTSFISFIYSFFKFLLFLFTFYSNYSFISFPLLFIFVYYHLVVLHCGFLFICNLVNIMCSEDKSYYAIVDISTFQRESLVS